MNDITAWQDTNNEYLSLALHWLRLRMLFLIQTRPVATVGQPRLSRWQRFWQHVFGRTRGESPIEMEHVTESDVKQAEQAMREAEVNGQQALLILSQRFEMSRFEQEILLLCAAVELDPTIAGLCASAQNNLNRPYPTFALAMALFEDPTWDALSSSRPLRYWRLIEINQPGGQPLTTSPIRVDERIVHYIKGLNQLDDRLDPLLVPFDALAFDSEPLPPSQQAAANAIVHYLEQAAIEEHSPILQLVGADSLSKQLVARQALARQRLLVRLPVELLPTQAAELETLARLWQRESLLLPVALYLDAHDGSAPSATGDGQLPVLPRLLSRDLGLVLLDTREIQPDLGSGSLPIDIEKPTPAEQECAWKDSLGLEDDQTAARLAGQFNLNEATIRQIARSVMADPDGGESPPAHRVWQACLLHARPRLDRLAKRLEPIATWDDIVLNEETFNLLQQISAQVKQRGKVYDEWGFRQKMNRGLGISALYAGESGTGKTMAAEVIANDLRLNLYRIDLSAVVSKYIGETEKNLRQVFDAAEDGGAILFFDEADALFGKRSEVKDSHDRYANIEINYLLQRMEEYHGLAILATNMRSALDSAFQRRLRFIINFPFPNAGDRLRIWKKVFPQVTPWRTPTEALDYEFLARCNLTGGSIHNVALSATFMAAQAGTPVTMPLLIKAARVELRKLEKPVNEADFRLPEAVTRRRALWQGKLGALAEENEVKVEELDLDRLAWLELCPEAIGGIVTEAVQRCASVNTPLTMLLLLDVLEDSQLEDRAQIQWDEPEMELYGE